MAYSLTFLEKIQRLPNLKALLCLVGCIRDTKLSDIKLYFKLKDAREGIEADKTDKVDLKLVVNGSGKI